jgi:hypothetical protein
MHGTPSAVAAITTIGAILIGATGAVLLAYGAQTGGTAGFVGVAGLTFGATVLTPWRRRRRRTRLWRDFLAVPLLSCTVIVLMTSGMFPWARISAGMCLLFSLIPWLGGLIAHAATVPHALFDPDALPASPTAGTPAECGWPPVRQTDGGGRP